MIPNCALSVYTLIKFKTTSNPFIYSGSRSFYIRFGLMAVEIFQIAVKGVAVADTKGFADTEVGGKVVGGTVVIDLAHFTAGGYLLAGVIADFWPIYLPVIALAAKSIPVFVRAGSDSFALSLLSYTDAFFTGALIILVIRMFFAVAPQTSRPRLWAGIIPYK